MMSFDFSMGPPNVSDLSTRERLEVMREYRRFKEQATTYDFSLGPPDVSNLEGAERLNVLRQYRHWQQSQAGTFGAAGSIEQVAAVPPAGALGVRRDSRDTAPTPRPVPSAHQPSEGAPPWQPTPQQGGHIDFMPQVPIDQLSLGADSDLSSAAGVKSGAHGSVYTYFERPLTAKDLQRVPPTAMQPEEPAPPVSQYEMAIAEAQARAEAAEGAAGVSSTSHATAWLGAWLDGETPRNCRKLIEKPEKQGGVTEERVFAPHCAPDERLAENTHALRQQMLEARQRQLDQMHAAQTAALEAEPVAGVGTVLEPAYTPSAPSAPDTVGMNRVAALEAKRAWRMQLADPSVGPPPPSAGSVSDREPIAGMTSEYRSRSVRGAVGQLDPASAADYNLSLKLAHATPRGNPALAPWVGGGERLQRLGAAEQPPLTDASNSMHANGMVPPSPLTGLSHAEKLQRMRELRQQADVEARQNLMSARNSPHM